MSRYYQILVGAETKVQTGLSSASNLAPAMWTNQLSANNGVSGKADLGAQQVEFVLPVTSYDQPNGQGWVRIWGPTKAQISLASDFNNAPIQIYGGMQPGLPLANDAVNSGQAGLLVAGEIYQAFGNWQGLNQTLEFIITSDLGNTQSTPANLQFIWKKGQKLGDVLSNCLNIAFPGTKITVSVDDRLILPQDEGAVFQTIQQLGNYVTNVSQNILTTTLNGKPYQGVKIFRQGNGIVATDGSKTKSKAIDIKQQDIIGQPTWLGNNTIQFNTVLRCDLTISSEITLPLIAGLQAVTNSNSASNARVKNAFNGTWIIQSIQHVGNSREPSAQSWISNYTAYSTQASPLVISESYVS